MKFGTDIAPAGGDKDIFSGVVEKAYRKTGSVRELLKNNTKAINIDQIAYRV